MLKPVKTAEQCRLEMRQAERKLARRINQINAEKPLTQTLAGKLANAIALK